MNNLGEGEVPGLDAIPDNPCLEETVCPPNDWGFNFSLSHSDVETPCRVEEKEESLAERVEIMDGPPPILNRPLSLVEGHSYAAASVWSRYGYGPGIKEQIIVRDDAAVFGGPTGRPLEEIGLPVEIGAIDSRSAWSWSGVRNYVSGGRPATLLLFRDLAGLVDRFVSFERSLADHSTMCELIAAYILSTWFLDAFPVVGYLWLTGEWGSAKSKLAAIIAEVSYLGVVLEGGASFPTVRDAADRGATVTFDDCEPYASLKGVPTSLRNLLLSGTRRDGKVPFKVRGQGGKWEDRWASTYCAKIFTATSAPEKILASRCVVVPMVRTAAPKANADPSDHRKWPIDRQDLVDRLWALALAHRSAIAAHVDAVDQAAPLMGRDLEPWRPLLSMARFISATAQAAGDSDLVGLYDRLEAVAKKYPEERDDLQQEDDTRLIVRALVESFQVQIYLGGEAPPVAPFAPLAPVVHPDFQVKVLTSSVTERTNELAIQAGIALRGGLPFTNEKRVGRILSSLRLREGPKSSGKGMTRMVTLRDLDSVARTHGLGGLLP